MENLTNYPEPLQIIEAEKVYEDTQVSQNNFEELNINKGGLDSDNTWSGTNVFDKTITASKGIELSTYSLITGANVTLTDNQLLCIFDTTSNAINVTLTDASTMLQKGIPLKLFLKTKGGSNNVVISCASGDTFNVTGNNRITFDAAEDWVILTAISANRWWIEASNSITLTTV